MKTTYFFLRHGEVYNPKRILYGRLPRFRISEHGRQQATHVAYELKKEGIQLIYSSPLLRARQTAKIISAILDIPVCYSSLLIEVKLYCEGIPIDVYHNGIQENLFTKKNKKKGQESVTVISNRMQSFIHKIDTVHKGKKILVISHGDPIMILKTSTLGIAYTWKYKKAHYLKTAQYYRLELEEGVYKWR